MPNPTVQARTLVTRHLGHVPAGGQTYVDRLARGLQSDVERAVQSLRRAGQSLGANPEQVERALLDAGLTTSAPAQRETATGPVIRVQDAKAAAASALEEAARALRGV